MPQVGEKINLPPQLKQVMTVNDPMFTTLTLARLQAPAAVLLHCICCLLTFWNSVSTQSSGVQQSKKTTRNRWKRGHVESGVDSDWSSGTESDPISLECGEKHRKNGDTRVTREKIGISDVKYNKMKIKNKHIRNILTFCIEIPQRYRKLHC
jgi:hypothetical protein